MTTKWFNGGLDLPPKVLEKIVGYFNRMSRPIYLGYVATEIGYSLAQTQAMVDSLVELGTLRAMTDEEKVSMKFDVRGNIYVLVCTPRLSKANL